MEQQTFYKNYFILIVLLIVLMPMAFGLTVKAGEESAITTLPRCYDDISIKVRGINISDAYYTFKNCRSAVPLEWKCQCNIDNETPIIINTIQNFFTTYDVDVQYFIQPFVNYSINVTPAEKSLVDIQNTNRIRTATINVVVREYLSTDEAAKPKPVTLPPLTMETLAGIGKILHLRSPSPACSSKPGSRTRLTISS